MRSPATILGRGDTDFYAGRTWQRRIREVCHAVRDAVGILDLPGFSRFKVSGPGTRDWLSGLITGLVPKPGRIGLRYFADTKGAWSPKCPLWPSMRMSSS